jgi:ribonuclease E
VTHQLAQVLRMRCTRLTTACLSGIYMCVLSRLAYPECVPQVALRKHGIKRPAGVREELLAQLTQIERTKQATVEAAENDSVRSEEALAPSAEVPAPSAASTPAGEAPTPATEAPAPSVEAPAPSAEVPEPSKAAPELS